MFAKKALKTDGFPDNMSIRFAGRDGICHP
jgi:hypothetical protein